MFTPQEVSEKTFPKASGFNNGYGMAAVDEFLDALTEDIPPCIRTTPP